MNTLTLERGTITIAKIFPAKAANRSATIKDIDGMLFGVPTKDLPLYCEGGTYEIEFSEVTKNDVTYRDIKRGDVVAAPPRQGQRAQATRSPIRQSDLIETPRQEQPRQEPQRPAANGNGNYYRPTHPRDGRRMFITATLGHFIETGRVDCKAQSIADAIGEICAAYDNTIGLETE
jgi:hypothetical protein